ncbi:hypothetical protein J18TS1_20130 [Oceanobacillus oncorhynchi subsp. incaldanensis]|uniref:Uncharacterized protein n=1 Tax=Oceanobacillus oncorhynchi TaxID=545501 RepID=A0A0A1MR63_9BACI|nr:hypothetical protein [Oceanobacillus oncorhynchi]MDM8101118.1 hypothetical protein [Oceanobacillus oncorhynchi]GIO18913.1 hypothetical protein J18TS1_20130 [Oceanobacillus oncorhynchi subsp. incaldanensis]CEI82189.1 hypothetical protein BN997_02048 [Oceanobacillus oncorhynchi]
MPVMPYLDSSDNEELIRFTFSVGTTGNKREAYYAGRKLMKFLLEEGYTLKELAAVQKRDIPAFVEKGLGEMLRFCI